MKKILIITKEQFGYLTDTYNYCINLSKDIEITYICIDYNRPKISNDNIKIIYVEKSKTNNLSSYTLSKYVIKHINQQTASYDAVFCVFFRFCFLIPLLTKSENCIMDIRTGNVNRSELKNWIVNTEIKFNSLFFKKISVISDSLASKLKLKKYSILPLGASKVVEKKSVVKEMSLLYVGTFNNRRIDETIRGYYEFLKSQKSNIPTKYTLIGDGSKVEVERILSVIKEYGLENRVKLVGAVEHSKLKLFFNNHNVGVSYVPITKYYDVQPPTKTFEYTINGLICIATKTSENKKIITKLNGTLCEDNPISFANGLKQIEENIDSYHPESISNSVFGNNWKNISSNILLPILFKNKTDKFHENNKDSLK